MCESAQWVPTFENIEAVVKRYRGPHKVRLHQNATNLGFARQVARIAELTAGDIIVMAAGDDVSHPTRVARHMAIYAENPGVMAVLSASLHRANGVETLARPVHATSQRPLSATALARRGGGIGRGATYSYHRRCLLEPSIHPANLIAEDKVLPLRAAILGSVMYIPDPLIISRMDADTISGRPDYVLARLRVEHQEHIRQEVQWFRSRGYLGRGKALLLQCIVANNPTFWRYQPAMVRRSRVTRRLRWLRTLGRSPQLAIRALIESIASRRERRRWPSATA